LPSSFTTSNGSLFETIISLLITMNFTTFYFKKLYYISKIMLLYQNKTLEHSLVFNTKTIKQKFNPTKSKRDE
ncbi:MAG: hypothetical protein PHW91_02430, partial [Bacteroidales bacterium]|nr:hypothetical protein [Bacteroidales bacterium]